MKTPRNQGNETTPPIVNQVRQGRKWFLVRLSESFFACEGPALGLPWMAARASERSVGDRRDAKVSPVFGLAAAWSVCAEGRSPKAHQENLVPYCWSQYERTF